MWQFPQKHLSSSISCITIDSVCECHVYYLINLQFFLYSSEVPTFQEETKALFGNLMDEGVYLSFLQSISMFRYMTMIIEEITSW